MSLDGRKIWQQAAGDKDRNYVETCLKWGIILNGPGGYGKWPESKEKMRKGGVSSRKCTDIKRFYEDMKDGDIVVLRLGTNLCVAVGIIDGVYQWDEEFGDIDGWDLQHVRRVAWLWASPDNAPQFETHTLKQGDTTQELTRNIDKADRIIGWIKNLNLDFDNEYKLPDLPSGNFEKKVKLDDIFDFLFDEGVASASINLLMQEMAELIRIAKWYQRSDNLPSEFETIAYLAVPFLRALGWTPQKMAIEWNRVDIALFSKLPRGDDNLSVVVEAKKKGNSCLTAVSQAEGYAKEKSSCKKLIVTDGIRYGVFNKVEEKFILHSYLNLTRLKHDYPIYDCKGAREAILAMTPESAMEV